MELLEDREFKRVRNIGIFLISVFTILTLSLDIYNEKLFLDSFIKGQEKVVGTIISSNPELKEEMANTIVNLNKISDEKAVLGRNILEEYGYNRLLHKELIFEINEIKISKFGIASIFIISGLLFLFLIYFYHRRIMTKISVIEKWTKDLIKGNNNFDMKDIEEGEISKLFMSFNKVNTIVTENVENLKKEKQFLVRILSDISHQLKTPLSAMILNTDMLIEKDFEREKSLKLLNSNERQLRRMQELIENLLKLAKLDANAINFKAENKSLKNTVQKSILSLEELANKYKVKMKFEYDESNRYLKTYDDFWVQEAILNVIKNCIEHSKENQEVNIKLFDENIFIRLVIIDRGEGIQKEEINLIFKRFYKSNRSKKKDSAGIGLNLAKTILEAQDADITVESELGKGTKFEILFLK
ncbi:MAG: sensor histidine kinase [Sarcina sp.]